MYINPTEIFILLIVTFCLLNTRTNHKVRVIFVLYQGFIIYLNHVYFTVLPTPMLFLEGYKEIGIIYHSLYSNNILYSVIVLEVCWVGFNYPTAFFWGCHQFATKLQSKSEGDKNNPSEAFSY